MLDIQLELMRYQRFASLGRDLEGVIHNAAGPLNIIMGYAQVLRSKYPEEKGFNKIWEAAIELDDGLKELTSHLESSELGLESEIDVNSMILRVLELMRANNYYKHNIEAVAELAEDIPLIRGVYGDIMICLDAILTNAIEAVRSSSIKKIVISSQKEMMEGRDWIKIRIRDTGEGFDEEKSKDYFELGYSGWGEGSEHHGVGLTLARYIINQSGGKIELAESCGCGAEAVLYIPIRDKK